MTLVYLEIYSKRSVRIEAACLPLRCAGHTDLYSWDCCGLIVHRYTRSDTTGDLQLSRCLQIWNHLLESRTRTFCFLWNSNNLREKFIIHYINKGYDKVYYWNRYDQLISGSGIRYLVFNEGLIRENGLIDITCEYCSG